MSLRKEKNREKKPDCRVWRSAIKNDNKTAKTVTKDYDSINNFKKAKKKEKNMLPTYLYCFPSFIFFVTLQKKLNNDYKRKEQDYMPLRLPDKLPAIELLKHENIFVMDESRAHSQEIRPLKICVLNLMPLKITTETDLVRLLSNTPLQIEVCFMKLKSHTPKNTPIEHMMMFYKDFHELSKQKFDGMIVTGAPIETMEYEDVQYWDEITEIFDWARTHVTSTLYICWGAQA